MRTITVTLTAEMDQYHEDISKFLDLMVHKLHKNVHKGRWESLNARKAYICLEDEVRELYDAIQSGDNSEVFLECADVANFAMIIASITRDRPNG